MTILRLKMINWNKDRISDDTNCVVSESVLFKDQRCKTSFHHNRISLLSLMQKQWIKSVENGGNATQGVKDPCACPCATPL